MNPEATQGRPEAKGGFWRYEYTVVLMFWLVTGFVAIDRFTLPNLLPLIIPDLNMNYTDAGMVVSITGITWAIASVAFGGMSDRWGRKVIIVPATVIFSLVSAVTGAAQNVAQLIGLRALLGLPEGAYLPCAISTIAEEASPEKRGILLGFHISAFSFWGLMVAPIFAAVVGSALGWRWVCFLTIIPGVILASLVARMIREPRSTIARAEARKAGGVEAAKAGGLGWGEALKHRNIVVCCILMIMVMGSNFIPVLFAMVYVTAARHIDLVQAGFIVSCFGVGCICGDVLIGLVSDYVGRRWTSVAAGLLTAVSMVGFAYAQDPLWLAVTVFFAGLFCHGLYVITNSVVPAESVPFALAGASVGAVLFIGEIFGGSIVPIIGGVVADTWGLPTLMLISAGFAVLAAIVASVLEETAPRVLARRAAAKVSTAPSDG